MPSIRFPRSQYVVLEALAARVIESRRSGTGGETLARDLLGGFYDICMRSGLDGVLAELEQVFAPLDISDLPEDPKLRTTLATMLDDKTRFDDGGPRATKLRQLAESLIATLSLTLTDETDRTITLSDDVRAEVLAALTSVIDVELAAPKFREDIIAHARANVEPRFHPTFDKIAAQLDDRGMRMVKQPKVPLDASRAVQQQLSVTRLAIVDRAARAAIDRALPVLARANADAAARIDQPITHRLTPRDVAIRRANESHISKMAASIVLSLFESLTEMARLSWRTRERPLRTYSPTQTFAVGDVLAHPKFGQGTVVSSIAQRIEVEFADGKHTLIHLRPGTSETPAIPRAAARPVAPSDPDDDSP